MNNITTRFGEQHMSNSNQPRIIGVYDRKARIRVLNEMDRKQNGLCRHCEEPFKSTDAIISNGKNRKYYHMDCAVKLSIIEIDSSSLIEMVQKTTTAQQLIGGTAAMYE